MRTSFHHQPEAQHPKSPAIHKLAGRLPHLSAVKQTFAKSTDSPRLTYFYPFISVVKCHELPFVF
jgi:hypothetical protein